MKSTFASLTIAALCASALAQTPTKPASKPKNPIDALLDNIEIPPGPAPTGCSKYELLVARGTSEFGPYGFFVGDPLVKAVKAAYPDSQGYAVNYPSNTGKDSLPLGAADIQKRLTSKSAQCPDMKFALSGYSQGASVIRAAFQNSTLTPAIEDKIVAVVLFGDPGLNQASFDAVPKGQDPGLQPFPKPVFAKLREFCNTGDPVCSRGTNFGAHMGYTKYATGLATDFIVAAFKGTPMPAKTDGVI